MHSAMTFAGSSSAQEIVAPKFGKRTGLLLVPCPKCGEEILELTCGEGSKVPGAIFFKCRLHERNVSGTCPWYLFADKYEKMLLGKGLIQRTGSAVATIRPKVSVADVEEIRIVIGRIEGLLEANKTELAPLLDDVLSLKNGADGVDEKLQKLIDLGKTLAVCLVVMAVFVVVVVVIMLVK